MARGAHGIIILFLGSRHGQLLGAIFLKYFRKIDIAKNVVLRWELVSFPYGAKAVHRSSVVSLKCLERQSQIVVLLINHFMKSMSF